MEFSIFMASSTRTSSFALTDYAGTVKQILVAEGQTVATDAVLMEIE